MPDLLNYIASFVNKKAQEPKRVPASYTPPPEEGADDPYLQAGKAVQQVGDPNKIKAIMEGFKR